MNTILLFRHFFKHLVYETSCEEKTPSHSVSLSLVFLLPSLSLCQLCCLQASPPAFQSAFFITCLPLTKRIINSEAVVLHPSHSLQEAFDCKTFRGMIFCSLTHSVQLCTNFLWLSNTLICGLQGESTFSTISNVKKEIEIILLLYITYYIYY